MSRILFEPKGRVMRCAAGRDHVLNTDGNDEMRQTAHDVCAAVGNDGQLN